MKDLEYWLALNRAPKLGPVSFASLLARFGTARAVMESPPEQLYGLGQLGETTAAYLRQPDWAGVAKDLAWLEQPQAHTIVLSQPEYPSLLKELPDPPLVLFVRGDPTLLDTAQLAMVGSRNPSATGRELAFEFARNLSSAGLTITSGLALGVDGASHRGALKGSGKTIAVAGTGPDRIYPARHRDLAEQILASGGALVTEFPTGTPPKPNHFPRRNRIISGLSAGTLVVEAAQRSGSLITAHLAAEQGREVFAIPGSVFNPLARGCHSLLREGAKLVEVADDIIEELNTLATVPPNRGKPRASAKDSEPSGDGARVLNCLGYEPTPVDTLVERSGLTAEEVSSILMLLELQGHVTSMPGGQYARKT